MIKFKSMLNYISPKRRIAVRLFLVLATLLSFGCNGPEHIVSLQGMQDETGLIIPGAGEYTVTRYLKRSGSRGSSRSIEAVSGNRLLKIEMTSGLSHEEAEQVAKQRLFMIQSLYSNLPSPYPGMVSNTISMEDALQPEIQEIEIQGARFPIYILPSNARYTYGAMNRENVAYIGGLCFLFNNALQTLYRLDYFIPSNEFTRDKFVTFFSKMLPSSGGLIFPNTFPSEDEEKKAEPGQKPVSISQAVSEPLQSLNYNLIIIALEPLGANHVSAYGYVRKTTPFLDRFAEDALLFENAVSPSSWSLPAFMSWFTSMYPSQHQLTNKYSTFTEDKKILANLSQLSPDTVTLTQVLKRNGFRTAGFTSGASLSSDFGFNLGFEEYYDGKSFGGFDITMPKAIKWLKDHKDEQSFLFVQGYDVHGQFPLEKQFLKQFLDKDYHGAFKGTPEEYWDLRNQNIEKGRVDITEEDIRFLRAVYDVKIFAADQRLASFIEQLKELGLLEKSIIVISSGSGNEYNEHGRIDHGFSLYEELIHVPLVIRIPGHQGRIPDLVRTIDIMPTVLDLLGLEITPSLQTQMQGTSLLPLINGKHLDLTGISETDYLLQAFKRSIKTDDGWKFIISLDTEKRELYDLNTDPDETKNLIETEGRRAYEMEQQLFKQLQN